MLLTETAYRPREALPPHDHERAYFCFVLSGAFVEREGGRTRECGASTVVFHPPGSAHSERFGDSASRCFNVELDSPWLERITVDGIRLPSESVALRRGRANWLARHLHTEFGTDDPSVRLAVEGFVLALLADCTRGGRTTCEPLPRWVDGAEEIVRAAGAHPPGLAAVAEELGVHPIHLARVFRRRHGISIGEYARRLRIERAEEALRGTELAVGRLAHRLGYADHSHFSRAFRRATGLSPTEYRKRHRR